MQSDQQRAAHDGEAQLRQHDEKEHADRRLAHRLRGFLESRIEPAQLRGNRQIDEGQIGQDRDQQRRPDAMEARGKCAPCIGMNEGGQRQRGHGSPGPEAGKG